MILVNTVNTVGVMGKGLALEFKTRYPEYFEKYKEICQKKILKIGRCWKYHLAGDNWIISFPTKEHWQLPSRYEYIYYGLISLTEQICEIDQTNTVHGIINVPALGCTNGGLDFNIVESLVRDWARQNKWQERIRLLRPGVAYPFP